MSTILIIEDEARIAGFIAKGLKAAGFTSHATASGVEGATLAVHGNFDMVILDVGLPDIDGFEVLERIRGQGVSVPVIMLTARSSVEDRVAGLEGGADDYMPKPFSFEELLARIRLRLRAENPQGGHQKQKVSGSGEQEQDPAANARQEQRACQNILGFKTVCQRA